MRNYRSTIRFRLLLVLSLSVSTFALPLQWQLIQPGGSGPSPRYAYATTTLSTSEGFVFLHGGINNIGSAMVVLGDTWKYDSAANSWEEVVFFPNHTIYDAQCAASTINRHVPGPRAQHTMISVGASALLCGGFATPQKSSMGRGLLDCWRFIISPQPTWDPMRFDGPGPENRYGHSMAYDDRNQVVFVFGGVGMAVGKSLNDCWYLNVSSPTTRTWSSCNPTSSLLPHPRHGHASAFHVSLQELFVFDGIVDDGESQTPQSSFWVLKQYTNRSAARWVEIMPISASPSARAYHAMWMAGFQIYVHGGQGPEGVGASSVLSDTWMFDILTLVWSQYGSSDASPLASYISSGVISSTEVMIFGGLDKDSLAAGHLALFKTSSGWQSALQTGNSPSARCGHVAFYDSTSSTMYVAQGMSEQEIFQDLWALDLSAQTWRCIYGTDASCAAKPLQVYAPEPLVFAAYTSEGSYQFVFGGLRLAGSQCSNAAGSIPGFQSTSTMWSLSMFTLEWKQVQTASSWPTDRAFATLTVMESFGQYLKPIVLFGGASIDCPGKQGSCNLPQPRNDLWVMDSAEAESSAKDKMASFDGITSIIAMTLPSWCQSSTGLGTLWIDMWVQLQSQDPAGVVLLDAYNGVLSLLRWTVYASGNSLFVRLTLLPDSQDVVVKTWGPIPSSVLGVWHHVCFTLRFGRLYSQTNPYPDAVLTQAFMFLDGSSVSEQGRNFLSLDISNSLRLSQGISDIYIGGGNPAASETLKLFKGYIDNFRLWWPACPDLSDPSRCNPYAFLYPMDKTGKRTPAARDPVSGLPMQDYDVQMHHVAKPVKESMYNTSVGSSYSSLLLIELTFDQPIRNGLVVNTATGGGSECQSQNLTDYCSGCPRADSCTFGNCEYFDTDCAASQMSDTSFQTAISQTGICQCQDIPNCPKDVPACLCPTNLYRVCSVCNPNIGYTDEGVICSQNGGPPFLPKCGPGKTNSFAPDWCPSSYCISWTCSCFDPKTMSGVYGGMPSVSSGVGTCPSACPVSHCGNNTKDPCCSTQGICYFKNSTHCDVPGSSTYPLQQVCPCTQTTPKGPDTQAPGSSSTPSMYCDVTYTQDDRVIIDCNISASMQPGQYRGDLNQLRSKSDKQTLAHVLYKKDLRSIDELESFVREVMDGRKREGVKSSGSRTLKALGLDPSAEVRYELLAEQPNPHNGSQTNSSNSSSSGSNPGSSANSNSNSQSNQAQGPPSCSPYYPFSFTGDETTRLHGADNQITLSFVFSSSQGNQGSNGFKVNQPGGTDVTITGLVGSQTAGNDTLLNVSCKAPTSTYCSWSGVNNPQASCKSNCDGISATGGSSTAGQVLWTQSTGTISFYIITDMQQDGNQELYLNISLTLKNRATAQPPRFPSAAMCRYNPASQKVVYSNSNGLLASNEWILSQDTIQLQYETTTTDTLYITNLSTTNNINPRVSLTWPANGFDRRMYNSLPSSSQFSGLEQTSLEFSWHGSSMQGWVTFQLDQSAMRRQGGCVSSDTLQICLPGYSAISLYNDSLQGWATVDPPSSFLDSSALVKLNSSYSYWAPTTVVPCCDMGGAGKSCGEKVCYTSQQAHSSSTIVMGGGTATKMPSILPTTRPAMSSLTDFERYLTHTQANSSKFASRAPFLQICPGGSATCSPTVFDLSWIPARFGHATAAVSKSKLLIYGGIGCATYSTSGASQVCVALTSPLNDLWMLDLQKALKGFSPFTLLEINPSGQGRVGLSMYASLASGYQAYTIGGLSSQFLPLALIGNYSLTTSISDPMTIDALEYLVGKRVAYTMSGAVHSFFSQVSNSTHAILFGGFVQNSLSNSIYTVDVSSSSLSQALSNLPVLAEGPPSRSYAGLASLNEYTLVMMGGTQNQKGLNDLWKFDLFSRSWTNVDQSLKSEVKTYFAFTTFQANQTATVLVSHGGILNNFKPGLTFAARGAVADSSNQVTSTSAILVFNNNQLSQFKLIFQTSGAYSVIPARCLHTIINDAFISGSQAGLIYGGVDVNGQALGDFWYLDTAKIDNGYTISLILNGVTSSFDSSTFYGFVSSNFFPSPQYPPVATTSMSYIYNLNAQVLSNSRLNITFVTGSDLFRQIMTRLSDSSSWQNSLQTYMTRSYATNNSFLQTSTWSKTSYLGQYYMIGGAAQFSQLSSCKSGACMRGICQNFTSPPSSVTYCYGSSNPTGCTAGTSSCSLPGPLHGHSTVSVNLQGKFLLLMMFGGESTDLANRTATWDLSSDVHTTFFSSKQATFAKLYTSCHTGGACPQARRDAAVTTMSNSASSNGVLLVYGGFGCGNAKGCVGSGMYDLMNGNFPTYATAFNDLWYLNLTNLDSTCVQQGKCTTSLTWVLVDVPGSKPSGSIASSIKLDSINLYIYIFGGTQVVDDVPKDSSDLFVFQTKTPFYKSCRASGDGLTAAVAGSKSFFSLSCRDVFGRSADGARFRIDVTGTNLPSMSPSTISLGSGSYQSAYSPVKAGTYTISIYVGNGGQEYQDLIAGDASASQTNPNPYTLVVSPAVTSPSSSVARGTFLTISTAGTSSSFIITARDEFLNRRPGGDSVSVLLTLWNVVSQAPLNPSASPNTGNVVDNADGSYGTTYRLTQSGSYMVSISFAGVSGAGSPFMLEIASAPAEIALTYVYGDLLNVVAGATSTLYVQTRDKYGNFLRVDPTAYPSGSEDIVFELCQTVGNDATLPCLGGNQDTNVGITISYAVGPSGSSTNPATGLPYYGLYQIVYFPFNEGSFVPEVKHNSTYVQCFFDTSGLGSLQMDPGQARANACYEQLQAAGASARRSLSPQTLSVQNSRRLVGSGNTKVNIKASFTPPDNTTLQYWLTFAPILCAVAAVGIQLLCMIGRFALNRRHGARELVQPADVLQAEQDLTPVKHKGAEDADTFQDFKDVLGEDEVAKCRKLVEEGDVRLLGAMDAYSKTKKMTARLMKSLADHDH